MPANKFQSCAAIFPIRQSIPAGHAFTNSLVHRFPGMVQAVLIAVSAKSKEMPPDGLAAQLRAEIPGLGRSGF